MVNTVAADWRITISSNLLALLLDGSAEVLWLGVGKSTPKSNLRQRVIVTDNNNFSSIAIAPHNHAYHCFAPLFLVKGA